MNDLIFVYGPPGSGKTTVGKLIADGLGLPFIDLDHNIEESTDKVIPQIFKEIGEPGFRRIEKKVLQEVISMGAGVCALGGGALIDPECLAMARAAGPVICLAASYDSLRSRLFTLNPAERPLLALQPEAQLKQLLANRTDHYATFSQNIDTDGKSPIQVAWEAQTLLGRFRLHQDGRISDICTLDHFEELGRAIQSPKPGVRAALVTDDHVGPLYAERAANSLMSAGIDVGIIQIPSGEIHKVLDTVAYLWDEFIRLKLERKSLVIAMGGGVVSDAAGFAAATFLRGLQWVVVPTSLLAMVDASIGGKTGIDLNQGKNLVGSFHFPRQVLVTAEAIDSLPIEEFRNGLAEVVKHAVIGDPVLFDICQQGAECIRTNLLRVVSMAIAVKIAIVQIDPFELNRRAELNFGHTIGHGLELLSNFTLRHGEAVSIGMVIETALAERIGLARPRLRDEIADLLAGIGLPTSLPAGLTVDSLINAMQMDKKRSSGVLHFSLPIEIGEVRPGVEIDHLSEKLAL